MIYTTFGRLSGLRVSEYVLGTGTFGTAWGRGAQPAEARAIFERFAEAGGTVLDTADNYQQGEAEGYLADLLVSDRDEFVLCSKYGRGAGVDRHLTRSGNSRRTMVHSVEESLRRLKTDRIDIYWAHYDDGVTPIEEIVGAFDDLVTAGKILYGGLSNFAAWRVARGQTIAELRGRSPLAGIQVEHSLVERTAERDLLPMAEGLGLGAMLYSPLGGGLLTAKHRVGEEGRPMVAYAEDSAAKTAVVDALVEVAGELGRGAGQVAIAWQRELARRATTSLLTVIGPRTLEQLDDYLAALEVGLSERQFTRLSEASAFPLGVPYDSIGGPPDLGDRARLSDRAVPVA
ncbi:aldo/keto reductase [Conexibacter stalactiti]|uniref:Aldo/keto reductase n=1 Tax=Conexibacter stalactiti TaxID=1940611 RepID=A0ABU4HX45_9ACTN|nr:aldo/keto reductase [Conexibacter stalactiti]MDW5597065.1 aldo/keto reductase [Conexibacter stalactiti]MEC5037707.1 aldo/keto reductase [Conexibacter stalactiti]